MEMQVSRVQYALREPMKDMAVIGSLSCTHQRIEITSILKAVLQKRERERAMMSITCDLIASR